MRIKIHRSVGPVKLSRRGSERPRRSCAAFLSWSAPVPLSERGQIAPGQVAARAVSVASPRRETLLPWSLVEIGKLFRRCASYTFHPGPGEARVDLQLLRDFKQSLRLTQVDLPIGLCNLKRHSKGFAAAIRVNEGFLNVGIRALHPSL